MPIIHLQTSIKSTIDICFDLSRSIDLHKLSTSQTNEEAIAGKTSGLINLNETVTWRATHFGIRQKLTTKITGLEQPFYFRDEQIKGVFKLLEHDHYFEQRDDSVIMKDVFKFETPLGQLGRLFNYFVLTKYMTRFLIIRNNLIKEFAETDKWKLVVNGN